MKYVIIILLLFTISCGQQERRINRTDKHSMYIWLKYDSGWSASSTKIYCDSIQMESVVVAYIWIDGVKQKVVAHRIRPVINEYYKPK